MKHCHTTTGPAHPQVFEARIEHEVLPGGELLPEQVMLGAHAHEGVDGSHVLAHAQAVHMRAAWKRRIQKCFGQGSYEIKFGKTMAKLSGKMTG